MRPNRFATLITILLIALLTFSMMPISPVSAQSATLVGYAVAPAETVTDGESAGAALAGSSVINGIAVPFASQPLGSLTGLIKGSYAGTYEVLSSGTFERADQSADFLLRIYVIEADFRSSGGGSGLASPVAWYTLTDPRGLLGNIVKAGERSRPLTGADLTPRGFARMSDGTYWIADARSGSLLHFDDRGKLLDAPINISADGTIMSMSATPDGRLIVAQGAGGGVNFNAVNPADGSSLGTVASYALDQGGSVIGGFIMIDAAQAYVIEHDVQDNGASKRVYLVNLGGGSASKSLVIDLTNIADPEGLSGQGSPFRFPYAQISGVAVADDGALVVVNNNRVPFSQVRQAGVADPTEFIKVRIG